MPRQRTMLQKSQDQEQRIADLRGGRRSAGSGNQWHRKNDVRDAVWLWEMKRTDARQITVKLTDLEELRSNAIREDRKPVLHCEIGTRRFVVLLEDDFLELIGSDHNTGESHT